MPLYEYRCKKCNEQFELMRRLAERDKVAACPKCGSRGTARLKFQAFAMLSGAAPDAAMGEGDPEDFMGGDHDHGHDHDDLDMGDFDF